MNPLQLMFIDPPQLSDETASEVLDFLYQLTHAFEDHYGEQLRHYYASKASTPLDVMDEFNDELPPF